MSFYSYENPSLSPPPKTLIFLHFPLLHPRPGEAIRLPNGCHRFSWANLFF